MYKKTTKTDFSYLAGYIDGDGCFYIGKERATPKRLKQKNVTSIIISSVNKYILCGFQELFGGSVSKGTKSTGKQKPLYYFTLKKHKSLYICENVLQFLVEKKEECILTMQFANSDSNVLEKDCISKMKIIKNVSNLVSKNHKKEFEQYKNNIEPKEEDFAYLAGFIDAECCLCIQKYKPKNKPNYVYKILLQLNNTKSPIFKWLLERFGGHINFIDRTTHKKAIKNQLCWRLSGKALSKIINNIHPFLKHKKPVCEELMKFYDTTLPNGGARHTEKFRSQYAEVIKIREKIVTKVHKLNLKGINT